MTNTHDKPFDFMPSEQAAVLDMLFCPRSEHDTVQVMYVENYQVADIKSFSDYEHQHKKTFEWNLIVTQAHDNIDSRKKNFDISDVPDGFGVSYAAACIMLELLSGQAIAIFTSNQVEEVYFDCISEVGINVLYDGIGAWNGIDVIGEVGKIGPVPLPRHRLYSQHLLYEGPVPQTVLDEYEDEMQKSSLQVAITSFASSILSCSSFAEAGISEWRKFVNIVTFGNEAVEYPEEHSHAKQSFMDHLVCFAKNSKWSNIYKDHAARIAYICKIWESVLAPYGLTFNGKVVNKYRNELYGIARELGIDRKVASLYDEVRLRSPNEYRQLFYALEKALPEKKIVFEIPVSKNDIRMAFDECWDLNSHWDDLALFPVSPIGKIGIVALHEDSRYSISSVASTLIAYDLMPDNMTVGIGFYVDGNTSLLSETIREHERDIVVLYDETGITGQKVEHPEFFMLDNTEKSLYRSIKSYPIAFKTEFPKATMDIFRAWGLSFRYTKLAQEVRQHTNMRCRSSKELASLVKELSYGFYSIDSVPEVQRNFIANELGLRADDLFADDNESWERTRESVLAIAKIWGEFSTKSALSLQVDATVGGDDFTNMLAGGRLLGIDYAIESFFSGVPLKHIIDAN